MDAAPGPYTLPEEENARIFRDEIVPDHLAGRPRQRAPVLVIVGGATGAGKTRVTDAITSTLNRRGGVLHINMDDFNPHHPDYYSLRRDDPGNASTHLWPDGLRWWRQAQEYAAAQGCDVIIESAMRTPAEFEDIVGHFGPRGYETHLVLMGVPEAVSRQGALGRFLDQYERLGRGRYVPPEVHDECYAGVARAALAVEDRRVTVDHLFILRRSAEGVYPSRLHDDGIGPSAALAAERSRPWTEGETLRFQTRQAALRTKAQSLPERLRELDEIDGLARPYLHRPGGTAVPARPPTPGFGLVQAARQPTGTVPPAGKDAERPPGPASDPPRHRLGPQQR
ncbi:zeta toxin family protein [Marinactinospora rubrisoli]|uniref:UDP-N-acetylglucosamine kinase n=1 Tax=Marinactinospora rubrisoli TaxID=2715399 RepID=A0ABW2KIX7_9ACTN